MSGHPHGQHPPNPVHGAPGAPGWPVQGHMAPGYPAHVFQQPRGPGFPNQGQYTPAHHVRPAMMYAAPAHPRHVAPPAAAAPAAAPADDAEKAQKLGKLPQKDGRPSDGVLARYMAKYKMTTIPEKVARLFMIAKDLDTAPEWLVDRCPELAGAAKPATAAAAAAPAEAAAAAPVAAAPAAAKAEPKPAEAAAPASTPSSPAPAATASKAEAETGVRSAEGLAPSRPSAGTAFEPRQPVEDKFATMRGPAPTAEEAEADAALDAKRYSVRQMLDIGAAVRDDFRAATTPSTMDEWLAIGAYEALINVSTPTPALSGDSSDSRDPRDGKRFGNKGRGSQRPAGRGGGRHQRFVPSYSVASARALLHKAENAYSPDKGIERTPMQKVRAKVIAICNKLSRDNLALLSDELLKLEMTSHAMMMTVVTAIFDKVLEDAFYHDVFAELSKVLVERADWSKNFRRVYEVSAEEAAENETQWAQMLAEEEVATAAASAEAEAVRAVAEASDSGEASAAASGAGGSAADDEDDGAANDISADDEEMMERIAADFKTKDASVCATECGLDSVQLEKLAFKAEQRAAAKARSFDKMKNSALLDNNFRPALELKAGWWFDVTGTAEDSEAVAPFGPFETKSQAEEKARAWTSFRRVLLNQCQQEFMRSDLYAELDEEEKADLSRQAALEARGTFRTGVQGELKRRQARRNTLRIRIKSRMLANVGFIGHLYVQGIAGQNVIFGCAEQLASGRDDTRMEQGVAVPDDDSAEAFCKLLCLVAPRMQELEKTKGEGDRLLPELVGAVDKWSKMKMIKTSTRFLCMDVLDAGKRGDWILPSVHKHAVHHTMTKKEFQQDEARREAEQQAQSARNSYGRGGFRGQDRGGGRHSQSGSRHSSRARVQVNSAAMSRSGMRPAWTSDSGKSSGGAGAHRGTGSRPGGSWGARTGASPSRGGAAATGASSGAAAAAAAAPAAKDVLEGKALLLRINGIVIESTNGVTDVKVALAELASCPTLSEAVGDHFASAVLAATSEEQRTKLGVEFSKFLGSEHIDGARILNGFQSTFEELAKVVSDGPRAPSFLGDLLGVMLKEGKANASQIIRSSIIAGPSDAAWQVVAAALKGTESTLDDLEKFGLVGTLPCSSARKMKMLSGKVEAAFGGLPKSLTELIAVREAVDAERGPAAAVEAFKAATTPKLSPIASISFSRATLCTAADFALQTSGFEAAVAAATVTKLAPLFIAAVEGCGSPPACIAALGSWVVAQLASGMCDDDFPEPFFAALVSSKVFDVAAVAEWKAGASKRSKSLQALAAMLK
ncbi:hypothetical protein FNF29_00445 [Cafeteria roenbergensis]|uniref:MI domain-containing protein n=1 Tax=Cafeteria roenbergensis TaxID=33653 RepID=A0A5A8CVB9_CAFRO|nr:hypothetical protein FNF29_00445 [Cafeteria roenbergensis]|eukprot:KAA0157093.1 hypothetical protein FNF29_00445 [Cafeteria roenbergensis]